MGWLDDRCCGDHPGDWGRTAVPGTGWCAECLARLRGPIERDPAAGEVHLLAEADDDDRPRQRGWR